MLRGRYTCNIRRRVNKKYSAALELEAVVEHGLYPETASSRFIFGLLASFLVDCEIVFVTRGSNCLQTHRIREIKSKTLPAKTMMASSSTQTPAHCLAGIEFHRKTMNGHMVLNIV